MSGYLLDTMVVSDALKPRRNPGLAKWLGKIAPQETFISSLTVGELQKGIVLLSPDTAKRADLERWLNFQLIPSFGERTLPVDANVALHWGTLVSSIKSRGTVLPIVDGLIAATASFHGLTVVTRNEVHFRPVGVKTVNPWS